MHWIALDGTQPVTASAAVRQKIYLCPECHLPVALRCGPLRQAHFYHVRRAATCAQHKKTEEHLGLQLALASSIPVKEVNIERPFLKIHRIADVAWETKKIVFEIQVSPITLQEAEKRCSDYRSEGWELIWILSDRRFNRRKLSAAESYLRDQTCYFSHWPRKEIYDQFEIVRGFRRLYRGPKIQINPVMTEMHDAGDVPVFSLPSSLKKRWMSWRMRTKGDLLSKACSEELKMFRAIEERLAPKQPPFQSLPWWILLKKCYLHLLNLTLTITNPK